MSTTQSKLFKCYWAGLGVILSLCVVGCDLDQSQDEPPVQTEEQTVWQELGGIETFEIASSAINGGSFARADGIVTYGAAPTRNMDVSLDILGGEITLWATPEGYLVVQGLEVDFADVSLGPDIIPPAGIELTGLQARVDFPAVALPDSKGDRVSAVVTVDLFTEWAIRTGGEVYPMTPVRLDNVALSVEVRRAAGGKLDIRLVALREGVFWNWANTFQLAELMVDLVSPPPVVN